MEPQTPPSKFFLPENLPRLAAIGAGLFFIAGAFAYTGGWLSPGALTSTAIVDRFEQVNGSHPGFRRNHAKGVCVTGHFDSNGSGLALSKAAIFQKGNTPLVGRFAFAGGMPFVPDSPHLVRSLAILLKSSNGEEWRLAPINLPLFPVRTPQEFYDFMLASAPDPATGKPDPARMKAFLGTHPRTAEVLQQIGSFPFSSGFADATYNSLNVFQFTNAEGVVTPVRWSLMPRQPFRSVSSVIPDPAKPNALFDALIADIHRQPLQWSLVLTMGQPGDPTDDATAPWPTDRQKIDVGTLTLDTIESEDTSPTRDINFDPLILPNGIAGSADPLLSARSAAYAKSFNRRESESKTPSAVSATETLK